MEVFIFEFVIVLKRIHFIIPISIIICHETGEILSSFFQPNVFSFELHQSKTMAGLRMTLFTNSTSNVCCLNLQISYLFMILYKYNEMLGLWILRTNWRKAYFQNSCQFNVSHFFLSSGEKAMSMAVFHKSLLQQTVKPLLCRPHIHARVQIHTQHTHTCIRTNLHEKPYTHITLKHTSIYAQTQTNI